MAQKLTVAVAGLGYFSQFHLNAWRAIDAVGEIHVTDPLDARVAWAQNEYAARPLSAATAPDIVDIIAPPPAHADLIRRFAAKGRVLICQKPFCTSIEEAQEMTDFAAQAGAHLVIHENFRFQPWHRAVKSFLDGGGMGAVYQCRFALRPGDGRGADAYLARQPAFRTMPRLLVHETGVHFLDLFRWLFGEITDVYADIRRLNPALAGEDTGVMILNHIGGAQSIFDGNRLSDHIAGNPRKTMGEMVIEGEKGALRLDGHGRLMFRAFGAHTETTVPIPAPVDEDSFGGGCVEALIRHVVDALQNGTPFENAAADYLPVIRATDAAYISAAEGRKVTL
ncbi:Gfo/Idh/MocA family oxidoreductase [Sulfitobacter sp. HNIBRBA2951]|uniref:Gfo/Idh/MocA family protein n=1 Tax=Sulfitobacter aquimarinus TaxID=3158557 RepID=UPI0032DE9557